MSDYPYADRFEVNRRLPEHGRPRAEVLEELRTIAGEEDAFWETGKYSGTIYCGDHEHYGFLNEAFGLFAHANALQRDMSPSQTRFEGEIIAMALDLMHAEAVEDGEPAGLVTSGGTASIAHAVLAYRDHAAGLHRPNFVKPETAHPAFDKACHLFGVELRTVPVDPETTRADVDAIAAAIDEQTIAIVGSAANYGYGSIDPIEELATLARERGVGMHVDACLGGFILPFGRELGYEIPLFDFRVPGVTSISADTHKYGYALKGTSTVLFRDKALRNAQYFFLTDWSGGKYFSPGMDGSRSGGLLAATWASMVSLGREGYLHYARKIFATSAAMQEAVRSHPELRLLGEPTFLFSFTSDAFDVYHVHDFMRTRGWRFNGQQYPNALHMAVTRPQTQPGVVEAFAADLADAVAYANERHAAGEQPASSAIYGGFPGGPSVEADELIRSVMADLLDRMQALPGVKPAPGRDGVCLAVDLGTGGPKVGFVRLGGEILWHAHRPVETRWLDEGGAVQDAAAWWKLIVEETRRGLATGVVSPEEIVAVAVTGQWASTVPVDELGIPVGDCILWFDTRGGPWSRAVIGGRIAGYAARPALTWVRRSGGAPSLSGTDPIGHMLYLQEAEPEVTARARWFLEPVDYLTMRFTGVASASHASMLAAWLTDNRRPELLEYDPKLLALSGVDATKLAPLRATGSIVGAVTPNVARELGIPIGAAVVTGVPDLHSATCGAGAMGDFETHLAVSTSSWIGAPVPFKKTDARHSIASVPGLSPDRYLIANNHESAGLCLQWLRDTVFPGTAFDELTQRAAKSPPGAGNVIFTPWLNGERSPVDDRDARAGFHNLSVRTRPEDLVRSVLEGVAYNARWLHDAVESFAGRRLDPIRIIGGGSQSDLWCQIHSDVMDREIERVRQPVNAGLRGAAILAALSLGVLTPADVRAAVPVEKTFTPDAAARERYDRLYAEFPRLYKTQKGMFARLNGHSD